MNLVIFDRTKRKAWSKKIFRPVQLAMGVSQREYGTNGSSQTVFKPFPSVPLFPFVPYSLGCSEFQNPIAQVEIFRRTRKLRGATIKVWGM